MESIGCLNIFLQAYIKFPLQKFSIHIYLKFNSIIIIYFNLERKKEKHSDQKRRYSPSNIYAGRDEARSLQKHNFAAIVQCCVCESIVDKERFGGRDTLFCSQKCISKKAEDARKVCLNYI